MKFAFTALTVLALSGSVLSQSRQPDPCAAAPPGTFVNDFAGCRYYFWCRPAALGGTTPTTPCGTDLGFDEGLQECNAANAVAPACLPCPAEDVLAVGDETDTTCRRYFFCNAGTRVLPALNCGPGTRFNRVKGSCDVEANVICFGSGSGGGGGGGVGGAADCTDPITGPVTGDRNSPASCASFFQCISGTATPPTPLLCPTGMHFNPTTNVCDLPANLTPRCVEPATVEPFFKVVPQNYSPVPSFKDRVFKRLHLN